MPTYDVSGHDLLSDDAEALDGGTLDAHASLAEDLLNLEGTTFTGTAKEKARRAIALQVSHQLRVPDEFAYAESERDAAGASIRYRGRTAAAVSPSAERLAAELTKEPAQAEVQGTGHTRTEVRTEHPHPSSV